MIRLDKNQDQATLSLSFGLEFEDLYQNESLRRIDRIFLDELAQAAPLLRDRLLSARTDSSSLTPKQHSELIIELAPYLEDFLGELFGIQTELSRLQARHSELAPLYSVKRRFVQRKALTGYTEEHAKEIDGYGAASELETLIQEPLTELSFAQHVARWLENEAEYSQQLQVAMLYAAWAALSPQGKAKHRNGVLFKTPHKLDMQHLVPAEAVAVDGLVRLEFNSDHWRLREGFQLTDPGTDLTGALDQAHYCIKCHNQGKDSCSSGLKEKNGAFKSSVFGVPLAGCPLDEKISEMNAAKGNGNPIGALAIVTIDNPMAAATGHRICNDCMKACIFQKQEPVDIPQVETRTLKDVLELPWGFEIYSLLTRWNPLNIARPFPHERTGRKVLIVGLGPAGFTLAHHLMNDGHTVVAVDGLKLRYFGRGCARESRSFPTDSRHHGNLRAFGREDHGRIWRGCRIRHHGSLEQELLKGDSPVAGAPPGVFNVWRRALWRDHDSG